MLDFDIGYYRFQCGRVVHHILTTVYESLVIEIDEYLFDESIRLFIECVSFLRGIEGGSHFRYLSLDMSSILSDPLLACREKCFSTDTFPALSLLHELLFDSCLCRYPSMICTRNPESRISTHTMIPDHDIFE